MWTQFVLRALAELPNIITSVEHNRSLEGGGRGGQKLADVNAAMTKIEGDTTADESTVMMRLQAIEALVGYANQLAAAERGLRPGRTSGGPANEQIKPAVPPVVTPPEPAAQKPVETPDDRLAAEKARALEAEIQGRRDAAKTICACFGFPPDQGQLESFIAGTSTVQDFVGNMVARNGKVVPDNLPPPFRPVVPA